MHWYGGCNDFVLMYDTIIIQIYTIHLLWERQGVDKWDGFGLLSSYQQLVTDVSFETTIKNRASSSLASEIKDTHTHTHIYMYVCMYVCIYTHTHIYS